MKTKGEVGPKFITSDSRSGPKIRNNNRNRLLGSNQFGTKHKTQARPTGLSNRRLIRGNYCY